MKMKVDVTQEVINRSAHCPTRAFTSHLENNQHVQLVENCMVSEGVREIFPKARTFDKFIDVFGDQAHKIDLPKSVTARIQEFDELVPQERRTLLRPFSFEIEVPSNVIDKIGIGEVCKILSESKTVQLIEF